MDSITEDVKEVYLVTENIFWNIFIIIYSQNILEIEKFLLSQEIPIPVYFSPQSTQLDEIYKSIGESTEKDSASSAAQGETKTLNKSFILLIF